MREIDSTSAAEAESPASAEKPRGNPAHSGGASTRTNRLPVTLRALRHRNFQLFFGGQLISLVGTWMQSVAQSWLVYRLTGSSLLLGVVGFASQIPILLLSPVAGTVADRYNRHRLVIATQTTSMVLAFLLAFLTLTHRLTVPEIMVLASLLGVVNAFDIPARQSFLVEMVGREDLMNAIALNSSMFNGARIVGPAIAGILVATIGEGWCFFANAVSFIAVIAGLLLMKITPREAERSASMITHIVEGFRFAARTAPIRAILLLVGLVSLVGMPYTVLMPIFADQILHGGARGLGILLGATGIGALLGALVLASRTGVHGLGRIAALSAGGFGVSLVVFAFSKNFYFSMAILVPVGFTMIMQMACANTLIQSMVPDRLRGRMMSLYSMMLIGMAPVGALCGGAIANWLSAPWAVAMGGAASFAAGCIFYWQLPRLRLDAEKLLVDQGMASPLP
ncbi:MAG TPA: MFS transporter [Candidatus Acidoferrales bacterium]|jgi:MFS family permease|nr:MFS transporter [Candidatus Acidoferrales bacterium]